MVTHKWGSVRVIIYAKRVYNSPTERNKVITFKVTKKNKA
jgi:hypothetical protein